MIDFHPIDAFFQLTKNERIIMIGLMLKMGCLSIVYVALPLWFHQPHFLCLDSNSNYVQCSHDEACLNESTMIVDIERSPENFVTYFGLYCSRMYIAANCQSILIIGSFLGCSFNVFVGVRKNKRRKFFTIISCVYFIACFVSLGAESPYTWSLCISLCYFTYNSCFGNIIAILNENFADEQKKYNFIFIWESYTLVGLLIAMIAYSTNSNWRVINFSYGLIMLFAYIALTRGRFQSEELEQTNIPIANENSWDGFSEVWKNILIFCAVWMFNFTTNIGVSLELGNLGSVYFNVMCYSVLEGVCALGGGYLVIHSNSLNLIKALVLIMLCLGFSFYFYNEGNSHYFAIIALVMKCGIELLYDILYVAITDFVPRRLIPRFVGLAQFLSRMPNIFLPYFMVYSKKTLGIHPFFFIGCGYVLVINLLRFVEPIVEIDHESEVRVSYAHSDLVIYEEVNEDGKTERLLSNFSQ